MTKIYVSTREGVESGIDGVDGLSIMENIRDNGFDELLALCGGCCSCATCHVYVSANDLQRLSPMAADENDLLDTSSHRMSRSRLSCQLTCSPELDGLRLQIAPED
jgi:2Fe-2S ferredoxin